jgi:hypothetical protein
VPGPDFGFVGVEFGSGGREKAGGLTLPDGGKVASEVCVSKGEVNGGQIKLIVDRMTRPLMVGVKFTPTLVAKLIYHEALHNRTGFGNHKLHTWPGIGLGQEEINEHTEQKQADIDLMADYLVKGLPNWTGGWDALDARWGPATNTPNPQNP